MHTSTHAYTYTQICSLCDAAACQAVNLRPPSLPPSLRQPTWNDYSPPPVGPAPWREGRRPQRHAHSSTNMRARRGRGEGGGRVYYFLFLFFSQREKCAWSTMRWRWRAWLTKKEWVEGPWR